MKNPLLLVAFVLLMPIGVYGKQNHVVNGSFEDIIKCPTSAGQVSQSCNNWRPFTNGTPDYWHTCGGNTSIPNNYIGYQHPAHGSAFCGFLTHASSTPHYEYIAGYLQPLVPGTWYEVSICVNKANRYALATDNIGVFFYDNGPSTINTTGILSATPQVYYVNYGTIKDTQNWVKLTRYFLADSAYDNMVIGAFNNANNTYDIDTLGTDVSYAYYNIDSVVVIQRDTLYIEQVDTLLCAGQTVYITYKSLKRKKSNNTFTIQLSNASGNFASPVNIGSVTNDTSGTIKCTIPTSTPTGTGYKMRIVASNFADTSDFLPIIKIGNTSIAKPVAANNGPFCIGDSLKLSATSATTGVSYNWAGPQDFSSSLQNPLIYPFTASKTGNYIVTAYIFGCQSKDTTLVSLFGPEGNFAFANNPVCIDDTLKLYTNINGSSPTFNWTGPNGFSSSQQAPIVAPVSPATSGEYRVTADNGKCIVKDTVVIVVLPKPQDITASCNAPVCEGKQVLFGATSTTSGTTFSWTGPNSFVYSGPTPTIGAANSVHNGNYIATATLNGCSLKDTLTLNVKPTPATPTVTNNGPLCEGDAINLTGATTSTGVTYGWTGPNSYTSGSQNPTITNTTTAMSGNYIVTATLDGCSSSATTTVLVKPMPAAVTVSSNSPVCEGGILQLASTASTAGATYNWTGPNSFTANAQNSSVTNSTTATTGWYKMNVDLNGCIYKDSVQAIVNVIPTTPVISYNSPLCSGETLTLNGGNISGGTYSWTGANNYTSTQSMATRSNMQTADAGIYKAKVTVNGCTSAEGSVTVSLNPAPFVVIFSNPMDSICQGDPAMFTAIPNNHGGTPAYRWMVNNQPVATGLTYTTTMLNDQDVIRCDMTESTKCSVPYKDASNEITMTVLPWLAPTVSITANPTTPLKENQYVTFTATPVNAGVFPTYQWKRNGQNIVGATGNTWSANTLSDNDNITVVLTSSYKCPQPLTASSNSITVRILTGVNDIEGITRLTLYPNPNKGSFIIKGNATLISQEVISIEVINSVGQVIHRAVLKPQEQNWQQEITLDAPAGVYLIRLHAANGTQNVKFNIEH